MGTSQYRELDRIDGKPIEFEWKICQGFTTLQILAEIQKMMNKMQCEPTGCMIFVSMYNDTVWEKKKETKNCVLRIPKPWEEMQEDSRTDIGRFLGLDQKRNGTELTRFNRMVNGIMSLKTWWSTSVKAHIPCSVDPVLSNEDLCEAKDAVIYTSVVIQTQDWFRQSAQCLQSSNGYVWWTGLYNIWLFRKYRETCSWKNQRPCSQYPQSCRQGPNHFWPMKRCKETC